LRFTGNPSDYTTLYTSKLGPGTWWIQTEIDSTDIKVYGRGTIDGNGYNTRKNNFMADLLVPVGTKNFVCDGIIVRDSSFWAVTPIQVEDALLTNLKVLDRRDVSQNDGVDVIESQRVTVRRAIAIANDDSFSAKTWQYNEGSTVPYPYKPKPQNDILFDNCLAWTTCFGYKIGQGVWEVQDNVTFQNSYVYDGSVGFGIHHEYGTETASNITFENIEIEHLHGPIPGFPGDFGTWLGIYVKDSGRGVGPVQDVTIKNIRARKLGTRNAVIQGHNESSIVGGVTISDVYMLENTTAATTLAELTVFDHKWSKDIKIVNS
jgi:polygalacturonase